MIRIVLAWKHFIVLTVCWRINLHSANCGVKLHQVACSTMHSHTHANTHALDSYTFNWHLTITTQLPIGGSNNTNKSKACSREPNSHQHHQSQTQTPLLLPLPLLVVTITRATTTTTAATHTHTHTGATTAILAMQPTREQDMWLTVSPMRVCSGSVASNTHTHTDTQRVTCTKSLPGQLFIWSADDSSSSSCCSNNNNNNIMGVGNTVGGFMSLSLPKFVASLGRLCF